VHVDRSDIFDTQGWPGLCDMVHVALVQGDCHPAGQMDVIASLSGVTYARIPEIVGPLACNGAVEPVCNDGFDNDGDGFVDHPEDPECADAEDLSERPQCRDGIDNDADGAADHPEDFGCASTEGLIEDPQCQDGIDNDGDGAIDFDGGLSVLGAGNPNLTDPDPQCVDRPWRDRERRRSCGLGFESALLVTLLCGLRRHGHTYRVD
jgi:hypothetical protein